MIPKKTTIYKKKPFAYVLSADSVNKRCDDCLRKNRNLQLCSGCKYVWYCDRTCQRNAWPVHRKECTNLGNWARKYSEILPDFVRLMARVITKLVKGGRNEKDYYTNTNFKTFDDLISHSQNIQSSALGKKEFEFYSKVLKIFMPESARLSKYEMWEIYGKVRMNSISLSDVASYEHIGSGIYLSPSLLTHSCDPNVRFINDGITLILVTTKDLPELDWNMLRVNDIDRIQTTNERREDLLENYYFWCECRKCTGPEPLAACPRTHCRNCCTPNDEKCSYCGQEFPKDFKKQYDRVVGVTSEFLTAMTSDNLSEECIVAALEFCLKRQEGILHRYNIQYLRTLKLAFETVQKIEREKMSQAVQLSMPADTILSRVIEGHIAHLGDDDVYIGKLYFLLARILFKQNRVEEGKEMVSRASSIMETTYGQENAHLLKTCKQFYLKSLFNSLNKE